MKVKIKYFILMLFFLKKGVYFFFPETVILHDLRCPYQWYQMYAYVNSN